MLFDLGDEALFYQSLVVFALLASLLAALLFYCLARVRRAEHSRAAAPSLHASRRSGQI